MFDVWLCLIAWLTKIPIGMDLWTAESKVSDRFTLDFRSDGLT